MIQQCLGAGELSELQVHLVPVLLGAGTPLFGRPGPAGTALAIDRVVASPEVTHIRYRPLR